MVRLSYLLGIALLAIPLTLAAQTTKATENTVRAKIDGTVLTWTDFPVVDIELDSAVRYLDGVRYALYGVADAETHLFVELDGTRIKRIYWIQFESYFPENDNTYNYTDKRLTRIGDFDYFDATWSWDLDRARVRAGSDTEHALSMITKRGYSLGPELMGIRLVRLDEPRRKELMIIYLEDLRDHGLTTEEVEEGGASNDGWEAMKEGLRKRALAGLKIREK